MVKMPFRRKTSNTTQVPQEISDYYQAEKKQRIGVAWLLTIATFLVTIVVVLGLFFGGRWIYRTVTDKNTTKPAPTSVKEDKSSTSKSDSNTDTKKPTTGSSSAPSTTTTPSKPAATTPPAPSTPSPTTSTTPVVQTPTTTPTKPAQVPNTGPGNVAAVFIGITVLGTVAYQIILRRRVSE